MKTFEEIRSLTEGRPEERAAKKQQSINRILSQFRSHRIDKTKANAKLRQHGHWGVTEEELVVEGGTRKKKSLKDFRGARTMTGERPNPVDTEPKLKLNKTVQAMSSKGY